MHECTKLVWWHHEWSNLGDDIMNELKPCDDIMSEPAFCDVPGCKHGYCMEEHILNWYRGGYPEDDTQRGERENERNDELMNGNYTRFDRFGSKAILNLKDSNRIMNFWHHTVIVRSTLRSKAVAKLPLHVEPHGFAGERRTCSNLNLQHTQKAWVRGLHKNIHHTKR